jgi:hypothetical protein
LKSKFDLFGRTCATFLQQPVDERVLPTSQSAIVSRNAAQLMDKMSVQEKITFNFDVRKIDWETYMTTFAVGVREYLFKDDLSSLPAARKNLNK